MTCEAFLQQIESDFDFLFEQYDFKVIYTDTADTREDHCLVILEASNYRIKFYRSWESGNVNIGTLSAPLSWDKGGERGQFDENTWFSIRSVLDFITDTKLDMDELFNRTKSFKPVNLQLQSYAEMLEPLCSEVVALFEPKENSRDEGGFTEFLQWRRKRAEEFHKLF